MNEQERKYLKQVITRAIKDGCVVSVNNGEEVVINHSRDVEAILEQMGTVEDEHVYFFNNIGGNYVGCLYVVYGNEPDEVINDWGWDSSFTSDRMKAIVGEYAA